MVMIMESMVFWVVMPCSLEEHITSIFRVSKINLLPASLDFLLASHCFYPEDGSDMFL